MAPLKDGQDECRQFWLIDEHHPASITQLKMMCHLSCIKTTPMLHLEVFTSSLKGQERPRKASIDMVVMDFLS